MIGTQLDQAIEIIHQQRGVFCSLNSNKENYKLDRFEHNRSSSSSMSKTFQVPCPGQIAPEFARDSYDSIYYAKVMYLEVGRRSSEVKKMKVGSGLSYEKLSLQLRMRSSKNENEKLKEHLQGMQWRVLELEKVCRKIQNQMAKILKSRISSHYNARSLPRLCS